MPHIIFPDRSGVAHKLALIIPTYKEAGNLPALLDRVAAALDPAGIDYEILVVDDDSRDGTEELMTERSARDPRVRLLVRKGERGLASAVVRGWIASEGALLGVMDADLQHPPELLPDLYRAIETGKDIVVASRYTESKTVEGWNPVRALVSRVATAMTNLVQRPHARVTDPMSGFFIVRRSALAGVTLEPTGFKILLEVLVRGNIRSVAEVPFRFGLRQAGESKASLKVGVDYLTLLFSLWRARSLPRPAPAAAGGELDKAA